MMPGMPERRTHDYVRHGITSLFAAFNIADGTVISDLHRQHRAVEFKKFLTTIDKTVPADLDVHLICDNYGTHKTPAIKAWLARHPRFHMHFTPTGSPGSTRSSAGSASSPTRLIRRGAHKSVQALEADIRAWIDDWNSNPSRSSGPRPPKRSSTPSPDIVAEFPAQDTSAAPRKSFGGSCWP